MANLATAAENKASAGRGVGGWVNVSLSSTLSLFFVITCVRTVRAHFHMYIILTCAHSISPSLQGNTGDKPDMNTQAISEGNPDATAVAANSVVPTTSGSPPVNIEIAAKSDAAAPAGEAAKKEEVKEDIQML